MKHTKPTLILVLSLLICGVAGTLHAMPLAFSEAVSAVVAGRTITLSSAGEAVFADILFPDADLAEQWMANHLLQQTLVFSVVDVDRYGRSVIKSDVQQTMLRDGVAVIYSFGHPPKAWQAAEDGARLAKRGVWGKENFVLTPENAAQHEGEFHVVEGVITHVYEAKSASYINFGADWRTDFSVTIPAKFRRGFTELLPQLREGARVRVRGSILHENGPMIRVTKAEQIAI